MKYEDYIKILLLFSVVYLFWPLAKFVMTGRTEKKYFCPSQKCDGHHWNTFIIRFYFIFFISF